MELKFFSIPARDPAEFGEELNRFLRGHRVLAVQRELVREDGGAWWAICVEYLALAPGVSKNGAAGPAKPKVDYRERLNDAEFAVFSRLREVRKTLAEREAVPVYAVFTNEQIAAMVTGGVNTLQGLRGIEGVGDSRAEKYGEAFLAVLSEAAAGAVRNGTEVAG